MDNIEYKTDIYQGFLGLITVKPLLAKDHIEYKTDIYQGFLLLIAM